jgi:hypothetical protein
MNGTATQRVAERRRLGRDRPTRLERVRPAGIPFRGFGCRVAWSLGELGSVPAKAPHHPTADSLSMYRPPGYSAPCQATHPNEKIYS